MKKLISIILTACICLSLLGGISIAGAAEGWGTISYTYDFLPGVGDNQLVAGTRLYDVTDYSNSPFCFFGADPVLTEIINTYNDKKNGDGELTEDVILTDSDTEPTYSISVKETYNAIMGFHKSNGLRFKLKGYEGSSFPNDRWVALKL
ncbi:MAG: hypothetical protein IJN97_07980, partial [Oscillospiraceae bacterium]|nr:hypothetical protein [Oscillospiraceae bacterium]